MDAFDLAHVGRRFIAPACFSTACKVELEYRFYQFGKIRGRQFLQARRQSLVRNVPSLPSRMLMNNLESAVHLVLAEGPVERESVHEFN